MFVLAVDLVGGGDVMKQATSQIERVEVAARQLGTLRERPDVMDGRPMPMAVASEDLEVAQLALVGENIG